MSYDKTAFERMMIFEEGNSLKLYRCTAGKLTIGVGRNIEDNGIRGGESQLMFWNDVADVERDLDRNFPVWRSLTNDRQMALVSMCFQLGWGHLSDFKKMLAAFQRADYRAAALHALDSKWAREDTPDRAKRMATLIERG